jgi:hypothetical protein
MIRGRFPLSFPPPQVMKFRTTAWRILGSRAIAKANNTVHSDSCPPHGEVLVSDRTENYALFPREGRRSVTDSAPLPDRRESSATGQNRWLSLKNREEIAFASFIAGGSVIEKAS